MSLENRNSNFGKLQAMAGSSILMNTTLLNRSTSNINKGNTSVSILSPNDSVLSSRPNDLQSKPSITDNSILANKPKDLQPKPSITNNSILASKPKDLKAKPKSGINTDSILSSKQVTKTKTNNILFTKSLFGSKVLIRNKFIIGGFSQLQGSPPPAPPTPQIGAFSDAYSNAYDGYGISAFSNAFSNAF